MNKTQFFRALKAANKKRNSKECRIAQLQNEIEQLQDQFDVEDPYKEINREIDNYFSHHFAKFFPGQRYDHGNYAAIILSDQGPMMAFPYAALFDNEISKAFNKLFQVGYDQ